MHKTQDVKTVGVIGARGYSGLELCRILLKHPAVKLARVFSTDAKASFRLGDYLPELSAAQVPTFPIAELEKNLHGLHTIFLATPAEASIELAPKLLSWGVNVIDLSGAFRLEASQYPEWYGFEHGAQAALVQAHYGLVPFASPAKTRGAQLISNPGCYATSVLMAVIPLLKAGIIDESTLVIDAKSGTSGAGRKAAENLLFTEVEGECLPYKIAKHQHLPEITRYAKAFAGTAIDPFFSTTLIPVKRGIISGVYAKLRTGKTEADVALAYQEAFSGYPLARATALRESKSAYTMALKHVVGSARVHLAYQVVPTETGEKLYLHSLIDNLMKGAASQAIENMNRILDLPVATGLESLEGCL